jgi:hypothetical protein
MKPQLRTIMVSPITPSVFKQLSLEHGQTLSCPCSTIIVPYKEFVTHTVTRHSVCSSIFISQQWIQALHLPDASTYGTGDFRTTASSQVN